MYPSPQVIWVWGLVRQSEPAARIFQALAVGEINVDMIIQNVSREGFTDLSFTVLKPDLAKTVKISRAIGRAVGAVERDGRTLVPLELYFGSNGIAKIKLALATGRKAPDKRDVEKKRDWDRQKGRLLRDRG